MASRNQRRKDRAKADIPIAQLLADLGYPVRSDAEDREEQFPCDLHGDGQDNKPSARVYPDSNSWFCFACGLARDTIDTVRAKHDLGFMQAIAWLEKRYGLDPLPFDPEEPEESKDEQARKALEAALDTSKTFEDDANHFRSLLEGLTRDRDLPMDVTLKFWEASDKLCYWVENERLPQRKGRLALARLLERLTGTAKKALHEDA